MFALLLPFAAISEANNQEVTFTVNEIIYISKLVDYVNDSCEKQYMTLESYLTGSEDITPEDAIEALEKLRSYYDHVRENSAELLNFFNQRIDAHESGDSVITYVLNTHTMKFHYPSCQSVPDIKESNRQDFYGAREEAVNLGYSPCGICRP